MELAVSFVRHQMEWPEETMRLTQPPAGHEAIEKDPVRGHRLATEDG